MCRIANTICSYKASSSVRTLLRAIVNILFLRRNIYTHMYLNILFYMESIINVHTIWMNTHTYIFIVFYIQTCLSAKRKIWKSRAVTQAKWTKVNTKGATLGVNTYKYNMINVSITQHMTIRKVRAKRMKNDRWPFDHDTKKLPWPCWS